MGQMGQQWMSILGWLACSDVRSKPTSEKMAALSVAASGDDVQQSPWAETCNGLPLAVKCRLWDQQGDAVVQSAPSLHLDSFVGGSTA
ncbi:hypothetical protein L207DRAFT_190920 [Hyaloscypha variabilis F]|uniref:Uncharacterized protein n=1 Tax=Hyaloscypha variabilis (strain UAMH 11265 / GT02V1 / F) TaxID=1149755 RepID=A0A2J6QY03_HYAVF|nr:hypothetical protein L207DRAFT_190920 [Hyaloscypha variabilis F]